jgi:hypothetical protein
MRGYRSAAQGIAAPGVRQLSRDATPPQPDIDAEQ